MSLGTAAARFDVRYKKSLGGESRPLSMQVTVPADLKEMSVNMGLAAGIAAFGLCLRDSVYKASASWSMAHDLVAPAVEEDRDGLRGQLLNLIDAAAKLKP